MSTTPEATAPKHTRGPWTLETVRTSCGICHKIGPFPWRTNKHNYACVYVDYPSRNGPVETELLANATLMQHSPEMFALTQRIASLNSAAGEIGPGMLAQLIDEACAIMAKVNP